MSMFVNWLPTWEDPEAHANRRRHIVWFPVNQPCCMVYKHKLATCVLLKQRPRRLGLLPVSLRSGDTNSDGPRKRRLFAGRAADLRRQAAAARWL